MSASSHRRRGPGEFVGAITDFNLTHADAESLDVLACSDATRQRSHQRETMLQRRTRSATSTRAVYGRDLTEEESGRDGGAPERYAGQPLPAASFADYQPMAAVGAPTTTVPQILHGMGK